MIRSGKYHLFRLRRIADTPRRISRGVFAGILVAFTPLFGIHFLIAPAIAWVIGGNLIASLISVLACNPLTFPVIAYCAIVTGNWILGSGNGQMPEHETKPGLILDAIESSWLNLYAVFSDREVDWSKLDRIVDQILLPYLIGGTLIGAFAGLACARVCLLVIRAYRNRRRQPDGEGM